MAAKQLLFNEAARQVLQSLTRRILLAQEDERAKISRKLHDDVAQEMLRILRAKILVGRRHGTRELVSS
jgi:signal transduction histidine kinase